MLRRINVVESTETKIFDMLRRIKDDKVKEPFQDIPDKKRNAPLRFSPLRSPFNRKM